MLMHLLFLTLSILFAAPQAQSACWNIEERFEAAPSFHFGTSLAISVDTLLVANEWTGTGAVAYVRSAGTWALQQELLPSTPTATSSSDIAVALDGDIAVLSNAGDDERGLNAGAAFVFRRKGGTWIEEAKLTASDAGANDAFGESVAIDEQRVAVGAPGGPAVYLFEQQGASWVETQRIGVPNGFFDPPLALDGDTLAIGHGIINPNLTDEVYVYVHDGTSWVFEQALPSPSEDLRFAQDLDLCGDRLAVGAPSIGQGNEDADAVYVYARAAGVWSLEATLTPDPGTGRYYSYGTSVALDGTGIAVGAPYRAYGVPNLGLTFVYARSGTVWSEQGRLAPPTGSPLSGFFGSAVDLLGTTIVVGEPFAPTGFNPDGGLVWLFESDPSLAPTVTYRNAGTNPVSLAASEARLGETLHFSVAPAMTGHSHALVFGFDSPITLTLGGGQTLLCIDLGGNGEVLNTGFQPGPFARFDVSVPYELGLIGTGVCTQAVHAFGAPGFALSNAQDLRIGPPSLACQGGS